MTCLEKQNTAAECAPVKVHGLGWIVFVGLVPVEVLREPVGGQQVGAGQGGHLRHLGLHPRVHVLNNIRSFYIILVNLLHCTPQCILCTCPMLDCIHYPNLICCI